MTASLLPRAPRVGSRPAVLSPMAVLAVAMAGSLLFLAVAGPVIWGSAAERLDLSAVLQGPSAAHPVGTDNLGRDLFARVLTATRLSLVLALAATLLGAVAGVVFGSLTAVVGGRSRRLLGSLVNLLLAFPGLLVAMFFAVLFGAGAVGAVLALAIGSIPGFARLTQTLAARVADTDFMAAARVLGLRRHRLLWRHVLPNIAEPLLLNTTISAGSALVALSGLSFLGLGVQAPGYDWGQLLSQGLDRIYAEPLPAIAPGLAIVYAALTFQLLGEVLAQAAARRHGGLPRVPGQAARPASPVPPATDDHVLEVEDLTVAIATPDGVSHPVRGISLALRPGEIVGLVGESGSGKSLTALALADLLPEQARAAWRTNRLLGTDVDTMTPGARDRQLATGLAMVFQNPASALNPSLRIGTQLTEAARTHLGLSRSDALAQARLTLTRVALPSPDRLLRSRPHQLSGGQRQRVMIATGLMTRPRLIIADEPTTALDVRVQRQIVELLRGIRREAATAVLFISHDVALVADLCDRVLVMYGGLIVECLPAAHLATDARHPYTRALVESAPDLSADRDRPLRTIDGLPPDPLSPGPGCPFQPRCTNRQARCAEEHPPLSDLGVGHRVACWHPMPPAAPHIKAALT
ncbi:dipeptide/oligopeptide/nickel ABC transporter permease/ATP-binding protein [Kitasatospora sp. NPDC001175]|uniref:dipeptide/oligopeptide/nickel ABC transporter permease/ATP-binding protein n=1 Tax=Kitasatospora sp. NPDC001175 TaxID=3157103 RepID=UPI003D02367B